MRKNRARTDAGMSVTLVAIMIPLLLGGLGLCVDLGHGYELKQRMQAAADAAAVAAAHEIRRGQPDAFAKAALEQSLHNGFSTTSAQIDVNRPPTSGRRAGDANFVEVIVTQEAPLFFMRALGVSEYDVRSRAVAGVLADGGICLLTLHSTAEKSLHVNGDAGVDLKNCSAHVDSTNQKAAMIEGKGDFDAAAVGVVGNYYDSSVYGFSPDPVTGSAMVPDPFASLDPPPYSGCTFTGEYTVSGTRTIDPGVYCGGLKLEGNVTLNPGVYVIAGGGMIVSGTARVAGQGVTFYNTKGASYDYKKISIGADSVVTLSAPTSGPLKGILFYQDRTIVGGEQSEIINKARVRLDGTLYFPTTKLLFHDDVVVEECSMVVVADKVEFNDKVRVTVTVDKNIAALPGAVLYARLVE